MKPGYKQTEVGVIPEEWETAAVADLVEPSAPICYGVVQVGQNIVHDGCLLEEFPPCPETPRRHQQPEPSQEQNMGKMGEYLAKSPKSGRLSVA